MFLEYVKHFFLFHDFFQHVGIFLVGNTTVIVFHNVEQLDKSRAGKQIAVIVIYRISQCVIIGIERSRCFQQFHLIVHPPFTEYTDSFAGVALDTVERNIFGNNLLHSLFNRLNVFQFDGTPDTQVAEIPLGYRMFHVKLTLGEEFTDRLIKNETEWTNIGTHARRIAYIEKLDILVVVHPKVKSFGAVVNLCTDHLIRKIKIKSGINIQKWASDREFFGIIVIFATYL